MSGLHNGEDRYKRQKGNTARVVQRGWNRRVQKAGTQGGKRQGWGIVCVRVYARQTLGSFFGEGLTGSLSLNELPF